MKKVISLGLLFTAFSMTAEAKVLVEQALYQYATRGDITGIRQLQKRGYDIDSLDYDGNTALCEAFMRKNNRAANILLKFGADKHAKCMKKITRYNKNNSTYGNVQYEEAGETTGDGKFLGMGKTGWLVTGAVAAVGAGVAIAASNHGGSSSKGKSSGGGSGGGSGGETDRDTGKDIIKKTLSGKNLVGFADEDGEVAYLDANNANVKAIVNSQSAVVGVNVSSSIFSRKNVYGAGNVVSGSKKANTSANIDITQKGEGDIYGMRLADKSGKGAKGADGENLDLYNAFGYRADAAIKIVDNSGKSSSTDKDKYGRIFGLYSDGGATNAEVMEGNNKNSFAKGTIDITSNTDKHVYGIAAYGRSTDYDEDDEDDEVAEVSEVYNAEGDDDGKAIGRINIKNNGNGEIYGIKSSERVFNATASEDSVAEGYIDIENKGNGDVYGIDTNVDYKTECYDIVHNALVEEGATAKAEIKINNTGSGNVYGINYDDSNKNPQTFIGNVYVMDEAYATGKIIIANQGDGDVYGMKSTEEVDNVGGIYYGGTGRAEGIINIANTGKGNAYGMYGKRVDNMSDGEKVFSTVEMASAGDGLAVGIYAKDGYIHNSGDIKIHNLGNGTAVGIYADGSTYAENTGNVTIDRGDFTLDGKTYKATSAKGGKAIGIYGAEGSHIKNSGTITIKGADTSYGIYSEGIKVENTGTIKIDGNASHENAVVLNGGKLFQNGVLAAQNLNLDDFGGEVIASSNAKFVVADNLSGDLAISNDVVQEGFDTTYKVNNMVEAGNAKDLNLQSKSALFEAKLQNNTDAVMEMKSFGSVVKDDSVAEFLQNNYAAQNNEKLFFTLKAAETVANLNSRVDALFGKEMFSRMAFEDISMLREINFDMNQNLFNQEEGYFALGSNISPSNYDNNLGSVGRYSLNGYNDGKRSFAIGMSISDIKTDSGNSNNSRFDRSFMMSAPYGYRTDSGMEFITTPKLGYTNGTYRRAGLNGMNYNGNVQKRMVALMNEARYPFDFSKMTLTAALEFNAIGYNIRGGEDDRDYSLHIKSQNHASVETGFGLTASREFNPSKDSKLKLSGGVAMYHEFADPYELELGMNGMSGTYKMRNDKYGNNRTVVRFGLDYQLEDYLGVTANLLSNIDRETRTDASVDMKYNF